MPTQFRFIFAFSRAFPKRCQIDDKSNPVPIDSVTSTVSTDDDDWMMSYAVVGDDFMRSLISFELFGSDFTDKSGECRWKSI